MLAVVPVAALVVGALVDRGPSGEVRLTVFHLALTVLDPAVWEAARNSLLLALATTVGAWVFGIGLARLGRSRFRGKGFLWASSLAMLAVPPLFSAIGWKAWLDRFGQGPAMIGAWGAALAAEWLWSVPLLALASARGLSTIDPTWEDAVRLAGGGPWRAWWRVFRPIVRPHVVRAAAVVFAGVLIEPGAPLVLGLRRTLAFQLVQAALRGDAANRAASLALMAIVLALIVRALLVRGRSGRDELRPPASSDEPARTATTRRILFAWLGMGTWSAFSMVPLLGLLSVVAVAGPSGVPESARTILDDPDLTRLIGHSAILGGLVASLGLLAAWLLIRSREGQGGDRGERFHAWDFSAYCLPPTADSPPGIGERLLVGVSRLPPLAVAVGALMVPGLLRLADGGLAADGSPAVGAVGVLGGLASWVDPVQAPGVLLGFVVLGVHLPALWVTTAALRERSRPVLFEAARTLGASRWHAWRSLAPAMIGPWLLAAWFRFAVLAGLDVAAALVLTPSSASRTLGPGVLDLTVDPDGLRRAALLALIGTAASLLSHALVIRRGLAARIEEPPR